MTKVRNGSPYKWPLNKLIPLRKYYEVKRLLHSLGWTKKSLSEVSEVLPAVYGMVFSNCYSFYVWRHLNLMIDSDKPLLWTDM